jgi:hypothetical protein
MFLQTMPTVLVAREGSACLQAEVVDAHGAGSPNHGDEALEDHHVVEGRAALFFAGHRAGDDSGLGGMEAGENAAGHGDEEDGDEVALAEVIAVSDRAVRRSSSSHTFGQGIALARTGR